MLALVILTAVAIAAGALDPAPPSVSGQASASDGDSFRLGGQRIRLLGMDAPELSQLCTDEQGADWPCGRAARHRMAELLSSGTVDCRPEDHDQYDRLLAICSAGEKDLGAAMVAEGLAVSAGRYWVEEEDARSRQRGIWAGGFERPRDWRDDHPRPQGNWSLFSLFGL